ncbi:MAG: PleD family two-component system response regulator [Prochloraceae cyanobacterium]
MKTVLVVEDTKSERRLMSALLRQAGFKVGEVNSVENAWNWLKVNSFPDMILLDIILPGINGLEFCRQIRSRSQEWQEIPILFCSSRAEEFDRFWALRQGGTDYITKPYAPQDLIGTVFKHLDLKHNLN